MAEHEGGHIMTIWYNGRTRNEVKSGMVNWLLVKIQCFSPNPYIVVNESLLNGYGQVIVNRTVIKRIQYKRTF